MINVITAAARGTAAIALARTHDRWSQCILTRDAVKVSTVVAQLLQLHQAQSSPLWECEKPSILADGLGLQVLPGRILARHARPTRDSGGRYLVQLP